MWVRNLPLVPKYKEEAMNRLMRRLASVFTGICQSNVAVDNAAHSDATLKNENMYMLT